MTVPTLLAFFIFLLASAALHAYPVQCQAKPTVRKPLPVRTIVVDGFGNQHSQPVASSPYAQHDAGNQRDETQAGLVQAFAVYQEVSPYLSFPPKHPQSMRFCQYDKMGLYSWPPTAVCWFPATAAAPTPQAMQALSTAWQPLQTSPSGCHPGSAIHDTACSSIIIIPEDIPVLLSDASAPCAHHESQSLPEEDMCPLNGSSALHGQTGPAHCAGLRSTLAAESDALNQGQEKSSPISTMVENGELHRPLSLPLAPAYDASAWPGSDWALLWTTFNSACFYADVAIFLCPLYADEQRSLLPVSMVTQCWLFHCSCIFNITAILQHFSCLARGFNPTVHLVAYAQACCRGVPSLGRALR